MWSPSKELLSQLNKPWVAQRLLVSKFVCRQLSATSHPVKSSTLYENVLKNFTQSFGYHGYTPLGAAYPSSTMFREQLGTLRHLGILQARGGNGGGFVFKPTRFKTAIKARRK